MVEDQAVVEDQVEVVQAAVVAAFSQEEDQARAEGLALMLGQCSPLQDRHQCHSKAAEWAWVAA